VACLLSSNAFFPIYFCAQFSSDKFSIFEFLISDTISSALRASPQESFNGEMHPLRSPEFPVEPLLFPAKSL
jgi:hypothetical protein